MNDQAGVSMTSSASAVNHKCVVIIVGVVVVVVAVVDVVVFSATVSLSPCPNDDIDVDPNKNMSTNFFPKKLKNIQRLSNYIS